MWSTLLDLSGVGSSLASSESSLEMEWSTHRMYWPYRCSKCGSNRDTGKRVFVLNAPTGPSLWGVDHGKSPCSGAEYASLKRQLLERDSQRDELLFKIKDLRENNRRYKESLESQLSGLHQQHAAGGALEKVHQSQLSERDHLISILQQVVQEHEHTIHQLENRAHGIPATHGTPVAYSSASTSSPSSSKPQHATGSSTSPSTPATSLLVADIRRLQDEKSDLASQLAHAQGEVSLCQREHVAKIQSLEKALEKEGGRVSRSRNKENDAQAVNGACSTDTEKELEQVQAENERLTTEVSSLHRFYSRNPTLPFSIQAERLRLLEEEKEELAAQLSLAQSRLQLKAEEEEGGHLASQLTRALVDKQHAQKQLRNLTDRLESLKERNVSLLEKELSLQTDISKAHTDERQTQQQLRDLQDKCIALQAKDPQVKSEVVEVEGESDELRSQVDQLRSEVLEWEKRCGERDQTVAKLTGQVVKTQEENQLLHTCLQEEAEKEAAARELAVSDVRRELQQQLQAAQIENQRMRLLHSHLLSSLNSVQQAQRVLAKEARQFPHMVAVTVAETSDKILRALRNLSEENKELVVKYHKEMKLRKKYHNELVELRGNIRVFCRVRPPIKEDGNGSQAEVVLTYDPDDDGLIYVSNKGRIQSFDFDRVFSPQSSQSQVFEEVRSLVTSCIDGYNVCIFAYGQTGSGKTFTMEGPTSDPGINQRALLELFSEVGERGEEWSHSIQVSVLEIYNETIRDLLSADNGNKLEVKMMPDGKGFHVPGLVTKPVACLQDVNQVFAEGRRNRATATTNMNEHSSRSHCLLCVTVTGSNRLTNTRSLGRLNLVDLAGSERVSKSLADGDRLKEAQNINRSLSCLGDVIHALRVKQSHIPFRNSKLTYLLQDSLGGDSKTLMIVQVSPVEKNAPETSCSLSFGQRVRNVELGVASRKIENVDYEGKLPPSPTDNGNTSSPQLKRKVPSPRSQLPSSSQMRFTPSKSPSVTRLARQTPRK